MFEQINVLLAPALMERLVLVVNHVLSREPQAIERLRPHAGRVMRLQPERLPRLLPPAPLLAFRITPAGLVEWCRDEADAGVADLHVRLDASNPAALALQMASGQPPDLQIEGDARFATDVDWLSKNLRWDVADDLQRLFGPGVAQQVHALGRGLARALRTAMQGAAIVTGRMRSR